MADERREGDDPSGGGPPVDDNRQRTLLAGDRTVLAWYRTSFGAYALAVGLGGVVPEVAPGASNFYRVVGVNFALLGIFAALLGIWQYVTFEKSAGSVRLPWVNRKAVIGFGVVVGSLGLAIALVIGVGG